MSGKNARFSKKPPSTSKQPKNLHIGVSKAYLVRLVGYDQRFFVPFAISHADAHNKALQQAGWFATKPGEQAPLVTSMVECHGTPPLNARPRVTFSDQLQTL